MDTDEDIAAGTVPGAKRAAVRKLFQELGIKPEQVPLSSFKYLTRLHYCAPDSGMYICIFNTTLLLSVHNCIVTKYKQILLLLSKPTTGTYGDGAEWGEHEVDYILMIKADVQLQPNAEEVMDTRYVTLTELKSMMDPSSGLLWSPWFRIIAENFLEKWWNDLDNALKTDVHVDANKIHKIMC